MFESVGLSFNWYVWGCAMVINCLSLIFFRLNWRWPLILWIPTTAAARESRLPSTWMAHVQMKQAPIPRRCPLCLPFLFGVSTDICVSTSGCAVTGAALDTVLYQVFLRVTYIFGGVSWIQICREKWWIFVWCSCWESVLKIGAFRLLATACHIACGMPSHCPPLSAGSWWTSKLSPLPKLPVMFPAMQLLFIKKVSFFYLTLTSVKHTHFSVKIRPVWFFFFWHRF